jgi:NADH:ubiquinone oxidoreductase subunit K
MRGTFQGVVVAALVATLSWTEIALGLAILAAVISSPVAERN